MRVLDTVVCYIIRSYLVLRVKVAHMLIKGIRSPFTGAFGMPTIVDLVDVVERDACELCPWSCGKYLPMQYGRDKPWASLDW